MIVLMLAALTALVMSPILLLWWVFQLPVWLVLMALVVMAVLDAMTARKLQPAVARGTPS